MKPSDAFKGDCIYLLKQFNAAPDSAWFGQKTVAAVRCCSEATIERERWSGGGIPFVKSNRSVRYTKRCILEWMAKHSLHQSTTDIHPGEEK